MIADYAAIKIVDNLKCDFTKTDTDDLTQSAIAIRIKILNEVVAAFTEKYDNPIIANIAVGLDTRQLKFAQKAKRYQLDLEIAFSLRCWFFKNEPHNISKSILDFSWINGVFERQNILFIAERLLMYFGEGQVKSALKNIGANFTSNFIAFDTIPKALVDLQEYQSADQKRVPFKWGNSDSTVVRKWGSGLKVQDYSYAEISVKPFDFFSDSNFKVCLIKIDKNYE
jgi:O-methyltransferase involved in polyketide biosynthesis